MSLSSRTSADDRPLREVVKAYGCSRIVELDRPLQDPSQLDYLDLLPPRASSKVLVHAVAEHQGTALLYLIDGRDGSIGSPLADVQRQLANRSDPAWLGLVRPGSLEIYPIGFHPEGKEAELLDLQETGSNSPSLSFDAPSLKPVKRIEKDQPEAPLFFQSLVQGTFRGKGAHPTTDRVYHLIYDLLLQTTNEYVAKKILPPLDVLSMAGRVLFFRFLIDRDIVRPSEREDICPAAKELKDAFSDPKKAAMTSAWLDETFNGDFLGLIDETIPSDDRKKRQAAYLEFYRNIENQAGKPFFLHLQAILRGWRATGGDFQPELELDWNDFDFAHIPVGVLSQVYESFSHKADPVLSRQTSVHYTPRTIAKLMVDEAFAGTKNAADAKVLDASCGAGIFLVLSFRRLVREKWARDGKRPDKDAIHRILYRQLRGFDVSESALRLAALGLYITAIEVNGTQRPPKLLKFPANLRGEVLYRFGSKSENDESKPSFLIGSLGEEVPDDFNGFFDIVIGNPPWTRLRSESPQNAAEKSKEQAKEEKELIDRMNAGFTRIAKRVLEARGLPDKAAAYENPDNNPDLPFLWRAAEWAKEGGTIALAMPARIFQRTTETGAVAWDAILNGVSLTGLINGADLRKTPVWDGMDLPWCLLFARNVPSKVGHRFYFSTPSYDIEPNRFGRFRIDYEAASPVSVEEVHSKPWLLKTLSLGTWLDVEVMDQLTKAFPDTLGEVWKKWNDDEEKTGKGYDRSPGLTQKAAPFLAELKNFVPIRGEFTIRHDLLETYKETHGVETAYWPKTEALYQPPLVIVPKSPGEDPYAPHAFLSDKALAFSQIYYGYSCAGHPQSEALSAMIYLIAHSTIFRFFALMVSTSQGSDRMMFIKQDLDGMPFPQVETLKKATKQKAVRLSERLQHDAKKPWQELDEFLFELYGLDADAVQVAKDTLFASASYRRKGRPALVRTERKDRDVFAAEVTDMLAPFFEVCGAEVSVTEPVGWQADLWREPWAFLSVSRVDQKPVVNPALIRKAMEEANLRGASRIIVRAPGKRGLLIGLLNQRRWWTVTRARLCAQDIIRRHLESCGLSDDA